ncbi:hypothetical protein MCOR14_011231 [Pyricularia oryzae]|nr:hypothetical protein MCOR34_011536 [Pyricularia oryzae]KAI6446750.1 hypothetical protein MCOR17_010698 [Pyricularia oryzae]KAI6479017.1 hypothetical protein MCOR13_011565 [Pyricularia oryzae]KAI6550937.1 hypothetical protein MCOR04_011156 [Pyricularia oryzae]KAI6615404.1 hypothetical protein MCOR14_011231 [Pyricularia oryzae]
MSSNSSPSPPAPSQNPVNQGDSKFPQGYCRYLLTDEGLKGQRCGCARFAHRSNIPGALCICGHQSCFHTNEPYMPELDHLKNEFRLLKLEFEKSGKEQAAMRNRDRNDCIPRLGNLEELVERSMGEVRSELLNAWANISQSWNSIRELESKLQQQNDRLSNLLATDQRRTGDVDVLRADVKRLEDRVKELHDADIALEERVEALETAEDLEESTTPSRPRRASIIDLNPRHSAPDVTAFNSPIRSTPAIRPRNLIPLVPEGATTWTTHISLLPDKTTPFPFEKDTKAYQRCLSRGLHQTVVVNGFGAEAFSSAVTTAFASLLKGRQWMPLEAQLCNAKTLQGLPMLRQLSDSLVHGKYDYQFLRKYCGVCDPNGRIESLYIAMRFDTLSWHALRHAPVYKERLEGCWEYDHQLDHDSALLDDDDFGEDNRPSAGDLLPPTVASSLKRTAAEISRSNSFGSSAPAAGSVTITSEGEGQSRPKSQRVAPNMVEARRRAERV